MSGLVDIWTSEATKTSESGQSSRPNGSKATSPESSKVVVQAEEGSSAKSLITFFRGRQVKALPQLALSESSVSMLVEFLSP